MRNYELRGEGGLLLNLSLICPVVRAEIDESNRFIRRTLAIAAMHDLIVPLFSANSAIEINDKKILFYRAAVVSSEISLQRLTQGDRILNDHVDFLLNGFFYGRMFFE